MTVKHVFASLLLISATLSAAISATEVVDLPLIPQPQSVEWIGEEFIVPKDTVPQIRIDTGTAGRANSEESYELSVTPAGITVSAHDSRGAIWARQTLRQLRRPDGSYPHVKIVDSPEFPIRGFLYDAGRNFADTSIIKEYIDLMSAYKLNTFQWHITDKPAWRIECKAFPRLNDGKFQRPGRDQGKFYTYDEIRDVIEYARQRGVMVIPEIDMPGHSDYFRTTFGVPMDSEEGKRILEICIAEFCEEIPAELCPYLHIGSDEVHIADPAGFMEWSQQLARSHGRKTMAWDPGLPADSLTVRQFWREGGLNGASYPQDVPFVDSGMGYLNNYDPLIAPAKIYFHTLCGTGRSDRYKLGGIVCLWNDVRVADKNLTALHNGMAGGIMAFSERAWHGGTSATSDLGPLGTLIPAPDDAGMQRFETFQKRMADHKKRFLARELSYWVPLHASEWNVELSTDSTTCSFKAYGDVLDLNALCREHGIADNIDVVCRLSREIVSDCDTVRYFKVGFEAPARSNRNSDGIAPQGKWPNEGTVCVNGTPLAPPVWKEPGAYRYHYNTWACLEEELPYTDEQLYWMRAPLPVSLKKGSNTVEMSLKRHFRGQHFQASFIEEP